MTTKGEKTPISLDELAIEKLSKDILDAIEKIETTVDKIEEKHHKQRMSSPLWVQTYIDKGKLNVSLHVRIPISKVLAFLGSLIGFIWAVTTFLLPALQPLFDRITSGP